MFLIQTKTRVKLALCFLIACAVFFGTALHLSNQKNDFGIEIGEGRTSSDAALLPELRLRIHEVLNDISTPEPILVLHSGGSRTQFAVALANFTDSRIFPSTSPRTKAKSVLVRSTDEKRQAAGGLTSFIANGCTLDQLQPLVPRSVSPIEPCTGSYASSENIVGVIDVVVVPWKEECISASSYNTCVTDNLQISLEPLLKEVRESKTPRYDTLVIPAIGTGNGGLSPDLFYASFAAEYAQKPVENAERISSVVFPIYDADWHDKRDVIQGALADSFKTIAFAWRSEIGKRQELLLKHRQLFSTASGLCLGIVILILISTRSSTGGQAPLKLGWLLASILGYLLLAFPLASGLQDWVCRMSSTPPLLATELLLAVISVPLLFLVKFVQTTAEDQMKRASPTSPDTSQS